MPEPFEVWCSFCGCQMKLRKGKYGDFWGCTGYPKCMRTMNLRDAANQHDPDIEEEFYLEPPDGSD